MDKISYSIKVSEEGRPTTLDTRQEDFKPLVEKYERRNIWNSWKLIFKNLRSNYCKCLWGTPRGVTKNRDILGGRRYRH